MAKRAVNIRVALTFAVRLIRVSVLRRESRDCRDTHYKRTFTQYCCEHVSSVVTCVLTGYVISAHPPSVVSHLLHSRSEAPQAQAQLLLVNRCTCFTKVAHTSSDHATLVQSCQTRSRHSRTYCCQGSLASSSPLPKPRHSSRNRRLKSVRGQGGLGR